MRDSLTLKEKEELFNKEVPMIRDTCLFDMQLQASRKTASVGRVFWMFSFAPSTQNFVSI